MNKADNQKLVERISVVLQQPVEISYEKKADFVHKASLLQIFLVCSIIVSSGFTKVMHSIKINHETESSNDIAVQSVPEAINIDENDEDVNARVMVSYNYNAGYGFGGDAGVTFSSPDASNANIVTTTTTTTNTIPAAPLDAPATNIRIRRRQNFSFEDL